MYSMMHAAFMQRLSLFLALVVISAHCVLVCGMARTSQGGHGVRVVEVVATCILQSWDGAAMAERGGRSVVAVRGYIVAL